jgi:hypothetical protein
VLGGELADGGIARRDLRIVFMQRSNDLQYAVESLQGEGEETWRDRHTIILSWGINYDEVRAWLSLCDREHPECQLEAPTTFPGLLVIDCEEDKIVPAMNSCTYVALSYVWGTMDDSNNSVFQTDLSKLYIPKTVRDGMAITRKLGLRYLWVDRYCIDQTDASLKHDLIANMDSVYRHAYVTIIAATGTGAEAGIAGVSSTPRRMDVDSTFHFTTPSSGTLSSGLPIFSHAMRLRPVSEVEMSVWASRGWTYQEALLGRRCLLFTDTHTAFQCSRDSYRENLGKPEDTPLSMTRVFKKIKYGNGIFGNINEYAVRELKFPSDSLTAFAGILHLYEKLDGQPVMHLWGMPLFGPGEENREGLWAKSLLWRSQMSGLQRVEHLPSWSWAGWRGWKYEGRGEDERSINTWRRPMGPYSDRVEADPEEERDFSETHIPSEDLVAFQTEIVWSGKIWSIADYFDARLSAAENTSDPESVLYLTGWTIEIDPADTGASLEPVSLKEYQDGTLTALVIHWSQQYKPAQCLLLCKKGPNSYSRIGTISHSVDSIIRRIKLMRTDGSYPQDGWEWDWEQETRIWRSRAREAGTCLWP